MVAEGHWQAGKQLDFKNNLLLQIFFPMTYYNMNNRKANLVFALDEIVKIK